MEKLFSIKIYIDISGGGVPFYKRCFLPIEIKYLYYFRKAQNEKFVLLRKYYSFRLTRIEKVSHIQIPIDTQIGEGFYIGHHGHIIINPKSVIGKNVNVGVGVTIGQANRGASKGTPTISDYVWIGTNAVIVGRVTIGTDVLIAPGAYVNFDVPDHSIVVGNPGVIIHREGATDGYINRTV